MPKVPAAHCEQLADPAEPENSPDGQFEHAFCPEADVSPGIQSTQAVLAEPDANVPAVQAVQVLPPVAA
jgi:hypothetical protein